MDTTKRSCRQCDKKAGLNRVTLEMLFKILQLFWGKKKSLFHGVLLTLTQEHSILDLGCLNLYSFFLDKSRNYV